MKNVPNQIDAEKFEQEKLIRDQMIVQRQQSLEDSSKQQLSILQEMLGKLDYFKNNLEGLANRMDHIEESKLSKVDSITEKTVKSNNSSRPTQQAIIENLYKGRPAWKSSLDAVSDLTSLIESEFNFENLRLKTIANVSNNKKKTSAPKLSHSKKISKQTECENNSNPTSGKQSAKFLEKRKFNKQMKEKNLGNDLFSVSNGSTNCQDYRSVAN